MWVCLCVSVYVSRFLILRLMCMCKWRGIWEDQSVHIWTNLDSILKSRDITLPRKVCLVKAIGFPVVIYGCESWSVKKAERWRIDGFELWCWRRLIRVPWIWRRSNRSILTEMSPGCSLEGLMLKLKLQYFGHLMCTYTHFPYDHTKVPLILVVILEVQPPCVCLQNFQL